MTILLASRIVRTKNIGLIPHGKTTILVLFTWLAFVMPTLSHASDQWLTSAGDAQISLISIKKNTIGETHHFADVKGRMDANGQIQVDIAQDSLKTGIEIRDQRINTLLMQVNVKTTDADLKTIKQTAGYAQKNIQISGQLPAPNELTIGKLEIRQLPIQLQFLNKKLSLTADVQIIRLDNDKIYLHSLTPILLKTADLGFDAGMDELQKLAQLDSITRVVPVSFSLLFSRQL